MFTNVDHRNRLTLLDISIEGDVAQIDAEIIGALLGAIVGAIFGAVAGAMVSRWSIRYDRQVAACSAMQALADEARFNAHVVRHMQEDVSDYSPSATERQAFDAALPVLYVLPPDLRDRSRDARSQILIMMHIDDILEMSLTKPGAPPAADRSEAARVDRDAAQRARQPR